MSYVKFPGRIHSPYIPGIGTISELWVNDDDKRIAFKTSLGKVVIVIGFIGDVLVGGIRMPPVFNSINGYIYWSSGGEYLYYSGAGWIYKKGQPAVMKGVGAGYYVGSLPDPFKPDEITELTPEGSYKTANSEAKKKGRVTPYRPVKVKFIWDWWMRKESDQCGVYYYHDNKHSSEKVQYFGYPYWQDNKNVEYIKESSIKFGDIHSSEVLLENGVRVKKWLIGTYGDSFGWWEGKEPDQKAAVKYVFTLPEPKTEEEKKERAKMNLREKDLTIKFIGYTLGKRTRSSWIFEAATWK